MVQDYLSRTARCVLQQRYKEDYVSEETRLSYRFFWNVVERRKVSYHLAGRSVDIASVIYRGGVACGRAKEAELALLGDTGSHCHTVTVGITHSTSPHRFIQSCQVDRIAFRPSERAFIIL